MNSICKKFSALFCAAAVLFAAENKALAKPEDTSSYRNQEELRARAGLPNFFKKAEQGKDIRVAYLGGSITAQSGWRVQSLDLFKKLYPKANFSEINAAIGGTGSDFGVLRVGSQVIEQKPDLVFIEFAVNDGEGGKFSQKNMEGIVRQIWLANPKTDICFVYTLTCRDAENMLGGKMKRSAHFMEDVADLYAIPSIDFGKAVIDLLKADKLVMKSDNKPLANVAGDVLNTKSNALLDKDGKIPFAKDGVHPHNNTGHVIYTGAIERSMKPLVKASKSGAVAAHKMPAPMFADCIQKVTAIPVSKLKCASKIKDREMDWNNPAVMGYKNRAISPYYNLQPGDEIEFKFKGTQANLINLLAYDSGAIELTVDAKKPVKRNFFDSYLGFRRESCTTLLYPSKDEVHTIKIKVLDENVRPAKEKLARAEHKKNAEFFDGKNIYISTIFLIGELAE